MEDGEKACSFVLVIDLHVATRRSEEDGVWWNLGVQTVSIGLTSLGGKLAGSECDVWHSIGEVSISGLIRVGLLSMVSMKR